MSQEPGRLRLFAEALDDLSVISALVQDALVPLGDMAYLPAEKSFMMALNRFRWESGEDAETRERVHAGLRFDRVTRVIEMKMPALITVSNRVNKPRFKTMNNVLRAYRDKEIVTWTREDLKPNPMRIGFNGSPTRVKKTFIPSHSRDGLVIVKQAPDRCRLPSLTHGQVHSTFRAVAILNIFFLTGT